MNKVIKELGYEMMYVLLSNNWNLPHEAADTTATLIVDGYIKPTFKDGQIVALQITKKGMERVKQIKKEKE